MPHLAETWNTMIARKQTERENNIIAVNLNEIYHGTKREQIVQKASLYITKVSENLLARFEAEKRRLFSDKMSSTIGLRAMNLNDISSLSNSFKAVFVTKLLEKDAKTDQAVYTALARLRDGQSDMVMEKWGIQDMIEEINAYFKGIDKAVMKSEADVRLLEKLQKAKIKHIKFDLPNITDVKEMYPNWKEKQAPKYEHRTDPLKGSLQMKENFDPQAQKEQVRLGKLRAMSDLVDAVLEYDASDIIYMND